ncbi:MAG: sodium-dependent transporter [Eggerthellaceae bacterium]|jgi:NSS family neurotransmitter:Na+ symporter
MGINGTDSESRAARNAAGAGDSKAGSAASEAGVSARGGVGADTRGVASSETVGVLDANVNGMESSVAGRESFRSRAGFILACIGSAVGMGNIWLFPTRISTYGGATFLVPYLIFVVLIASTGVIGEMSFGRATRKGPIGAFSQATQERFGHRAPGAAAGIFPVVNSLAMAIGYSVVVGWICKYLFDAIVGADAGLTGAEQFAQLFSETAADNSLWLIVGMVAAVAILVFGVSRGIERANEVMMPLFFFLFVGLAIYVATLPGASAGYAYLFMLDPAGLLDPAVWVFALGQAFFSLSVAGCGTLIYGSYLKDDVNVPFSAGMVALFDTLAALLASAVIIPVMATAGQRLSSGGPGLLFIYLPTLFAEMPAGRVFEIVFFVAVLFGGLSSLINLFEAPISTLQELFGMKRRPACLLIGGVSIVVGLLIQPIVSPWMDVCSIYGCPIGALLAAVMFFWVLGPTRVLGEVNRGRTRKLGRGYVALARYGFCGVTLVVLIAGSLLGGIG